MDTSTLGGSLEPKLKLSTYEWDDTKSGAPSFWQFMMAFSALVRMTLYGDIFEDLLDVKCRRNDVVVVRRPCNHLNPPSVRSLAKIPPRNLVEGPCRPSNSPM